MAKYILSVDGGGIRGIIPAIVLAEIEYRTKKPISQMFDLMVGTSTGGIIVAGLCNKQYSALDLVDLYQKDGSYQYSLLGKQMGRVINLLNSLIIGKKSSFAFVSLLTGLGITSARVESPKYLFRTHSIFLHEYCAQFSQENIDLLKNEDLKICDTKSR